MTPRPRLTVAAVAGVAFGMLGLSFAAEPIYTTFCRITGFGGTTQVAVKTPEAAIDRRMTIRFDATIEPGSPLDFRPEEPSVEVAVGDTLLAFYELTNTSDRPVAAIAGYNVAPFKTGRFFNKIECFCFRETWFAPGETVRLPVVFFVDPEIDDDRMMDDVRTITLSYTYYVVEEPTTPAPARLEAASARR